MDEKRDVRIPKNGKTKGSFSQSEWMERSSTLKGWTERSSTLKGIESLQKRLFKMDASKTNGFKQYSSRNLIVGIKDRKREEASKNDR